MIRVHLFTNVIVRQCSRNWEKCYNFTLDFSLDPKPSLNVTSRFSLEVMSHYQYDATIKTQNKTVGDLFFLGWSVSSISPPNLPERIFRKKQVELKVTNSRLRNSWTFGGRTWGGQGLGTDLSRVCCQRVYF